MDTGAYMQNQMDNLVEKGIKMEEIFNDWLFTACSYKSKEPHDIFPYIDLTDAKLDFIDGMSALEYSKKI
jgi:hypothetical protein